MNLAYRDIAHQWQRFLATGVGLGLLFTIVLAMGGIYKGMVVEATVLLDTMQTDLWIVQKGTRGPFAERSVIPESLETRARAVPGVSSSRPFSTFTIQPVHKGKTLRLSLVGLSWPEDKGERLTLAQGRFLSTPHDEIVVDKTLGLSIGETLHLGDRDYRVVGIGKGLVSSGGDALGFVTQRDADLIQQYLVPEALRVARASGTSFGSPGVSAVLVNVKDKATLEFVRAHIAKWDDVSVYTTDEQKSFLLEGVIDKARRQIGLFRALLAIVSGIVVSLVIFNMTVSKSREIALLKLMGAKLSLVVGMIVKQSLTLSLLAFGVALLLSQVAFPAFPRRVIVGREELIVSFALSIAIALLASIAAVRRALRIPATTILAG